MKKNYKILIIIVAVIIVGSIILFINLSNQSKEGDFLNKFKNQDVTNIVQELENDLNEPENIQASITPDFLIMNDDKNDLNIPTDQFYLSIAPYVDTTHECFTHNLITCRGELVNKEIKVTFVDNNDQEIYNETKQTYNNGFYGLWLPKNISGTISVEYDGKKASQKITTTSESPTCITTLKLI